MKLSEANNLSLNEIMEKHGYWKSPGNVFGRYNIFNNKQECVLVDADYDDTYKYLVDNVLEKG